MNRKTRNALVRPPRSASAVDLVVVLTAGKRCKFINQCCIPAGFEHADPADIRRRRGGICDFDVAVGKFALAYADQAERDHTALRAAVRAGKIDVQKDRPTILFTAMAQRFPAQASPRQVPPSHEQSGGTR